MNERGWRLRPAAGLTLLVLAGAAVGCGGGDAASADPGTEATATSETEEASATEEERIAVALAAVEHAPMASVYTTSATLRAEKEATVTARTRGVVRRLLVEEGDRVVAGQELAILENDEQRIEFERLAATRDTRRRELARVEALHSQGLTSDEEYETRRREAEETRHAAALAELTLARTVIRAPFGGVVLRRHLDVGATVADGTAVFDLADLDPLYADIQVPERHVNRLAVGQGVRLSAEDRALESNARIERIAPLVEAETGTIKVTLAVPRTAGLRPGSFVRGAIVTETRDEALVVPRSALVAEGRRWHLFRLGDDAVHVERLEVTRGFEDENRVEIVSTVNAERPLVPGDRVVSLGAAALSDGAAVRDAGADGVASGDDERVGT